jgi:AraC-like DNA-binding protein
MGIVLSTGDLRPDEREAYWRHVMSDTFAPVAIGEMTEGDVAGSIRGHWVGRLLVTDVQSTGQDIRRTPRLISEADNAYFQVAVVASGIGRIGQDDRQAVLHPGDCVLYETTRPFQWLFDSDWDVWVFSLPAESVRLSESERRLISARSLDGTTGLTGVVSRFLLDLARHSEDLPAEQSERVLAHASDLVVALLSDRLDDSTQVRGAVQRSLMLRIKDYIHQRLSDPALGPAEIAAAVNISTRYLHRLFEAERQTVALYIKGLRLDRARRDLLDPRLAGRPITTIAYSCGFGDLSGFNRAFKAAYALSPAELRNASASDRPTLAGPDW